MSPSRPTQRRAVLASGVSLLTSLAGCSTVFNQSSEPETYHPPPLHRIILWNYHETEIRVTLVVKRNGNIVHWDTHKVRVPNDESRAFGLPLTDKEWIGCGLYDVSVRLQDESQWATVDFQELEPAEVENGKVQAIHLEFDFRPEGVNANPYYSNAPYIRCQGKTTGTRGAQN